MEHRIRTWIRLTAGVGLIVAGIAMLVLPGPGLVAIAGGVAMLERDLPWLQRLTAPLRERIGLAGSR